MSHSEKPSFDDAHFAGERHHIFPLAPRSKKPRKGDDWRKYEKERLMLPQIRQFWGFEQETRLNIGILAGASQAVIVDADSKEAARTLYQALPKTDMVTITPNGGHLFFRAESEISPKVKARVKGITCDIRAGSSYVVAPGSVHPTGQLYERYGDWNWDRVPVFDPSWIEPVTDSRAAPSRRVQDGWAYIGKIRAVAGEGGHNATFRAACKLRDSGLAESEALACMIEWNKTNAEPPWTTQELLHKVRDAYTKGAVA